MKLNVTKYLRESIIVALILAAAVFFRTNNLEGKMTFEWDQERDFTAVETMFTTGKPLLLGPIVRGDSGGFYLGPMYYYLITPLYYFSGGNPLSLAILSIGMDLFVIIAMYLLIRKFSPASAIITIAILAGSPLIIHNSFTPWNVSLVSVWMIGFLLAVTQLRETDRFRYKFLTIFLASLTSNIHLSLVPIALALVVVNYRSFLPLRFKQYVFLASAAIMPITTLIIHDLTHGFENTILLKRFLFGVSTKSASISQIISLIVEKFGYTIGRLFTGEPYTYLGWLIVATVVVYAMWQYRTKAIVQASLLSIACILVSLVVYRDVDFAEYYFIPTFIPLFILLALFLRDALYKIPLIATYVLVMIFCLTYARLGLQVRAGAISPYSLTIKKMVIQEIANLGYPVEVRTSLPRERNTGFPYLMKQMGVASDQSATKKAYIYESKNLEVISPPEARSIILDKPIKAFKLIVFSN